MRKNNNKRRPTIGQLCAMSAARGREITEADRLFDLRVVRPSAWGGGQGIVALVPQNPGDPNHEFINAPKHPFDRRGHGELRLGF